MRRSCNTRCVSRTLILNWLPGLSVSMVDLISINDKYADGRDVSWLWDADFEVFKDFNNKICITGSRADDMALRLKYAGADPGVMVIDNNIKKMFDFALNSLEEGEKLIVLPTYTSLLKLNKIIKDRTK